MKENIPTFALVVSLAMILTALVVLSLTGKGADGPVVIGLVGAVGTAVGVIGGFSQQTKPTETKSAPVISPNENEQDKS